MKQIFPMLKPAPVKFILPPVLLVTMVGLVGKSIGRDFKVTGGLSTGYEWYDRRYDDDSGQGSASTDAEATTGTTEATEPEVTITENLTSLSDDDYSRFRITPLIGLSSVSARDEFEIRYKPSFRYDVDSYDHDIDHDLTASASRYITQNWELSLDEKFVLSDAVDDDSILATSDSTRLSDNEGRRTYWTNEVKLESHYTYWEDSIFSTGYIYKVLTNEDLREGSNYEDYDRHEVFISAAHRFDSIWKLTLTGRYVRGFYEQVGSTVSATDEEVETQQDAGSEEGLVESTVATVDQETDNDLREYRAETILESTLIEQHPLSMRYSFYGVDYDDPERSSAAIHDGTLGWKWNVSKDFSFSLGAGPTYQQTEGQDGEWGYNANLGLEYRLERGSLKLTANRGFDRENFSGTDETGLKEYWQSRLEMSYSPLQQLTLSLFASYRYEDQEEITSAEPVVAEGEVPTEESPLLTETEFFNRQRYMAGAKIGYDFGQWYKLSLAYDYTHQDSEREDDSYDDHRATITLSYEQDLFKW